LGRVKGGSPRMGTWVRAAKNTSAMTVKKRVGRTVILKALGTVVSLPLGRRGGS